MPQNERMNDFNPGIDKVWGSFVGNSESEQSPSRLDSQAAMAGRAIVDSAEHEQRRVNKARGIVTYQEGEPTAIVFNAKSTDVISFYTSPGPDNHKYIDGTHGTYLIQTESGNQYVLHPAEGLVISARGDVYTDVYALPEIEFGKPWQIEGKLKTTPVKQLLSEYKTGNVAGDFHRDTPSPFVWANKVIEQVVDQISSK